MHLLTYMQAIGQIYFEPVPQGTSDTMGPQLEKQFRMGNSINYSQARSPGTSQLPGANSQYTAVLSSWGAIPDVVFVSKAGAETTPNSTSNLSCSCGESVLFWRVDYSLNPFKLSLYT